MNPDISIQPCPCCLAGKVASCSAEPSSVFASLVFMVLTRKPRQSFCLSIISAGIIGICYPVQRLNFLTDVILISHLYQLKTQMFLCLSVSTGNKSLYYLPLCWGWRMSRSSCLTSLGESWYKSTAGSSPPRICSSYSMAWMIHLKQEQRTLQMQSPQAASGNTLHSTDVSIAEWGKGHFHFLDHWYFFHPDRDLIRILRMLLNI